MSVFAQEFVLADCRHTRCEPPATTHLEIHTSRSMTLDPIGGVQLATFVDRKAMKLYVRLYGFASSETAWYEADWKRTPNNQEQPR